MEAFAINNIGATFTELENHCQGNNPVMRKRA
jgi:hypothetical protein